MTDDALFWKLSGNTSPFLSAGLAAWIEFKIASRSAKANVRAVQPILQTLAVARRYCLARKGELEANENGLELPPNTVSILMLKDRPYADEENAAQLLNAEEKDALGPVFQALSMGTERAASMDPSILGFPLNVYVMRRELCP
jgi:hypothetical protein